MTAHPDSAAAATDPDAGALRRASRSVGLQLAVASTVLVLLVLVAAFSFVLAHLSPDRLLVHHDSTIDVSGLDILVAAAIIGAVAIALAGLLSWFATRRAIRPLGEALRLQRDFVSNASHELRTPLAVLDARLQYLQRGLPTDDPTTRTVTELRRDTGALIQIVNDLLAAAEEGGAPLSSEPVDLRDVVSLAVDSMRILAAEKAVTIAFEPDDSPSVMTPAAAIHRCMIALLDNAMRFSPRGSTITVGLLADRTTAEVRVADQGSGFAGLDPRRAFDRFARGDNDGQPGFGIGLALVKETVERSGGSATVEVSGNGGTVMLLRLPRARRR